MKQAFALMLMKNFFYLNYIYIEYIVNSDYQYVKLNMGDCD